jgi:hypothetical protein
MQAYEAKAAARVAVVLLLGLLSCCCIIARRAASAAEARVHGKGFSRRFCQILGLCSCISAVQSINVVAGTSSTHANEQQIVLAVISKVMCCS